VGGFYGSPPADLYLRWAWFGALSPLNRYHGATSRLPWDQPGGVYPATRQIVATRYRLLPYLYSAAIEAVRQSRTWLRPMIAACPGDRAARDADGQYLIGTDLLAAPVTAADGEQDVYLPAGRWIDYATRVCFEGGRWQRLTRPPEQAPLFVRHGALLPVDPSSPTGPIGLSGLRDPSGAVSAADDPGTLALEVWGGAGGTTTVHEHRGATRIALTVSGGAAEITVTGPAPLRRVEWPRIAGEDPPGQVAVNGRRWIVDESDRNRVIAAPAS
jgi:alpha-D-xyloside xylohydrolase